MCNYVSVWKNELPKKSKLYLFRELKEDWSVATHLTGNISKYARSLLSQIRLGSLGLEIEKGRYEKKDREQRICKLCGNDVETEIHFLFECNKLTSQHLELYKDFPELLNETPTARLKLLCEKLYAAAKHITKCWQEQKYVLNSV